MFVVVFNPESNEVYLSRELTDDEIMDERIYADMVADWYGVEIDDSDGYIPGRHCCGDIRVEFKRDPENSVAIFSGESFYFKQEDY